MRPHRAGETASEIADWLRRISDHEPRHPVIRTGERPPIPGYTRLAVYMRDSNRCALCCADLRHLEKNLDHVLPWSAGGPDTGTNLRTTCPPCNEHRSNRRHFTDDRRRLPVTWWCLTCWCLDGPMHYSPPGEHGLGPEGWRHNHPPIHPDDDLTLAYCASCRCNGYTNRPL